MMIPLDRKERNPAHAEINSYGLSCLLARGKPLPPAELRRFAAELMTTVSRACYQRGAGDAGHIKSYIEYEGGFLMADTVGDPSEVAVDGRDGDPAGHFRLVVNAVVYGLDKAGVEAAVKESIAVIALAFGLSPEFTESDRP